MRNPSRRNEPPVSPPSEQRPLVRVLRGEEELRAAIAQALEYDRLEVARVTARISHYEEIDMGGRILQMPVSRVAPDTNGGMSA
jgi:hypothetical protein